MPSYQSDDRREKPFEAQNVHLPFLPVNRQRAFRVFSRNFGRHFLREKRLVRQFRPKITEKGGFVITEIIRNTNLI